jgi:hypothetical protein
MPVDEGFNIVSSAFAAAGSLHPMSTARTASKIAALKVSIFFKTSFE